MNTVPFSDVLQDALAYAGQPQQDDAELEAPGIARLANLRLQQIWTYADWDFIETVARAYRNLPLVSVTGLESGGTVDASAFTNQIPKPLAVRLKTTDRVGTSLSVNATLQIVPPDGQSAPAPESFAVSGTGQAVAGNTFYPASETTKNRLGAFAYSVSNGGPADTLKLEAFDEFADMEIDHESIDVSDGKRVKSVTAYDPRITQPTVNCFYRVAAATGRLVIENLDRGEVWVTYFPVAPDYNADEPPAVYAPFRRPAALMIAADLLLQERQFEKGSRLQLEGLSELNNYLRNEQAAHHTASPVHYHTSGRGRYA